jgi:hypothetical protein
MAVMQLRNRRIYRFDEATASLYRGLEVVAERTLYGHALYTREEWDMPWSDPHLVIDPRGRILRLGAWTGYTAEELTPVRDCEPDTGMSHWPIQCLARLRRRSPASWTEPAHGERIERRPARALV